MTVLIYVNTSKQVGDPDHLKVFVNQDAAETWSAIGTRPLWSLNGRRRLISLLSISKNITWKITLNTLVLTS